MHLNNTPNTDNFSLIYYIYRKIPEPDSDGFYWLFTSVHYPFFYPFSVRFLFFFQENKLVTENKNFSEKTLFFSVRLLFALRSSSLLTEHPAWSAGIFFIYGTFLLPPAPDDTQRVRAPPDRASVAPAVMRVMPTLWTIVNSPQNANPGKTKKAVER